MYNKGSLKLHFHKCLYCVPQCSLFYVHMEHHQDKQRTNNTRQQRRKEAAVRNPLTLCIQSISQNKYFRFTACTQSYWEMSHYRFIVWIKQTNWIICPATRYHIESVLFKVFCPKTELRVLVYIRHPSPVCLFILANISVIDTFQGLPKERS